MRIAEKHAAPAARAVARRAAQDGATNAGVLDFERIYHASAMERIELIKDGVGAVCIFLLAERMATSQDRLIAVLGFPRTTVMRKSKSNESLSIEQTERVVGLSRLIGQVQSMVEESGEPSGFDAAQWVAQWIERPNPALGGGAPAELMDTVAGQELVGAVLARMQGGAYA
ncbi:MAG: antitoxin Xre/MbcA/ParS toxin-binding domain-containing protein [Burkholderia sp.]